ncbi:MAG TPA: endonuclease V, partial [Geobacteraceae bacterium]|nr:endonuclease V [Geobacteraceae bacterium]
QATAVAGVNFPYVPGYLFFREGPAVLAALAKLARRHDLLMVDGHGTAHPKKAGYACLLGALLDMPSIGCAKSRLVGNYEEPGIEKGNASPLIFRGETVGAVVRTRRGVRPVFVSAGHLTCLDGAVDIVLRCATKFRIPEPLRTADALAGKTAGELGNVDAGDSRD